METKARENRYGVAEILEAIYFLRTEVSKLGPKSKLVSIKVSKDIEQRLIANFMQSPSFLYAHPEPEVLIYAGVKIETDEELPELERMIEVGGVWFGRVQIKQLIWLAAKAEKLENEAVRKSQLLQKRVDELEASQIHTCHDDCQRLECVQRRKIEGLEDENKKMREALSFYADENNWRSELPHNSLLCDFLMPSWGPIARDSNGKTARKALGEVKDGN